MIIKTVQALRPGAEFSTNGEEPTSEAEYLGWITWLSDGAQPTWAEIEAHVATVAAEVANENARQARMVAFRDEADPLFFGWQRGENTEQEWLDKCAEIRDRFPYVPVPPLS